MEGTGAAMERPPSSIAPNLKHKDMAVKEVVVIEKFVD